MSSAGPTTLASTLAELRKTTLKSQTSLHDKRNLLSSTPTGYKVMRETAMASFCQVLAARVMTVSLPLLSWRYPRPKLLPSPCPYRSRRAGPPPLARADHLDHALRQLNPCAPAASTAPTRVRAIACRPPRARDITARDCRPDGAGPEATHQCQYRGGNRASRRTAW